MINPYNPASKRPPFNSLQEALKFEHLSAEERRARRRIERNEDPEWQAIRRGRQEMYDRQKAEEEAKKAEAAKHARVGCPPGFNAHVDRDYHTKLSFLPYLERALRDYEKDHPDQAPAPRVDVQQEAMDRRNAESLARARALEICTSKADLERLLAVRPTDFVDEEAIARNAARHKLRLMAADPLENEDALVGEHPVAVQDVPNPMTALETADPEPVKRGRGRPPKFIAEQRYEITPDGAIIED